jgi:hypothetical protein
VDGTSSSRGPVQDEGAVIVVGTVPCRMPPGDRLCKGRVYGPEKYGNQYGIPVTF